MIRIRKPARAPLPLREEGKRATTVLVESHEAGCAGLEFDSRIYGCKDVKDALKKAQHGKCCFCEAKVAHISPGDVEHFRPKAACRQSLDDPLLKPGYYWLAYDWSNLYFSCEICNRREKRNHFPLQDDGKRARTHKDRVSRERPMFIDPGRDDPTLLIGFRDEIPYPINDDPRAHLTIEALGLKRDELNEHRLDRLTLIREHLSKIRKLLEIQEALRREAGDAAAKQARAIQEALDQYFGPKAEYSSMVRCFIEAARRGKPSQTDLESISEAERHKGRRKSRN